MIRHRDKEKEIDVVYYLQFDYTTLAIFLVYFADADAHNQDTNRQIFRKGAESSFCLWQELRKINQKIAQKGDDLDFYSEMVRFYTNTRTCFEEKC